MKKISYLIVSLLLTFKLSSQDFSLTIIAEDYDCNIDSVIIGYDKNATDSVDIVFGETNIIDLPLDSLLDIRIVDGDRTPEVTGEKGSFNLKKQIKYRNCWENEFSNLLFKLDVYCKHRPFKIYFDNLISQTSCVNNIFITDWFPGGWFDAIYGNEEVLAPILLSDTLEIFYNTPPYSFNHENDTIKALFVSVGIHDIGYYVSVKKSLHKQNIKVYPNPFSEFLIIELYQFDKAILQIFDSKGQMIINEYINNSKTLMTKKLTKGIYLYKLYYENEIITGKMIKI